MSNIKGTAAYIILNKIPFHVAYSLKKKKLRHTIRNIYKFNSKDNLHVTFIYCTVCFLDVNIHTTVHFDKIVNSEIDQNA